MSWAEHPDEEGCERKNGPSSIRVGHSVMARTLCSQVAASIFFSLGNQVALVADFLDEVQLGFEPIDVAFFVFQ